MTRIRPSPVVIILLGVYLCVPASKAESISPSTSARPTAATEAFESFFGSERLSFDETPYGNGCFGRWITDDSGQPAYEYQMDQRADSRAAYFTSAGSSRDHWHLIGNNRMVATAHNGGHVQFYDWTRGGKAINRWCPQEKNYSGGFKFIQVDDRAFPTLWESLPSEAKQRRVFGAGYFEKTTHFRELTVTERIEAPPNDDPALLSVTVAENHSGKPLNLAIVEFWDVNLHQLTPGLIMTGRQGDVVQRQRAELNRKFVMDADWQQESGILSVSVSPADPQGVPKPHEIAQVDYYPKAAFLAALDPLPHQFKAYAVDQELFFDGAGINNPCPPGITGAADGRLFSKRSAFGGRAVLAMRRALRIEPQQKVQWRYLFGYVDKTEIPQLVVRHRKPIKPAQRPVLEIAVPGLPWLGRELLWHSYYLQAGSLYSDFLKTHFVDQGSAYGYLQGLTGAHRDFALFTLPMVYLRPDLAKEMLRFTMRSQDHRTGALPYAHMGYGAVSGAVIYGTPSDLGLFFSWALSEYLAATRDLPFLRESVPFYPPSANTVGTVLDHARAAFRHLTNVVGLGPHGLIRCGSNDWNDELIALSPKPDMTRQKGESSLNAGLATLALPALAGAVQEEEAAFAALLREFAAGQARALKPLWTGEWVARGYLGQADAKLGGDRLFLDTQAFGVLGGVWDSSQLRRLFEQIDSLCVRPQRIGAMSLWPPVRGPSVEPGSDTNGGTWAAIDSWIAWAWSRTDAKRSWDFYLTTTLAARSQAYPNCWYGVWSGPDSYNAHYHARPEGTFNFKFTPMTDFPVMNMNRHAGPLLDAIKLAGIEPRDGQIVIDPHLPLDTFVIRLPLLGIAYRPDGHRGYYNPVAPGTFRFAIRPPASIDVRNAKWVVNGRITPVPLDDTGLARFEAPGKPGDRITWELIK